MYTLIMSPRVYKAMTTPITKKARTWRFYLIKKKHNKMVEDFKKVYEIDDLSCKDWDDLWEFAWFRIKVAEAFNLNKNE